MKITNTTRTFAQNENDYILTNEQDLTFANVDIIKHRGCLANVERKTLSPELPIGALTKATADWVEPDRQLSVEELKDFKRLK